MVHEFAALKHLKLYEMQALCLWPLPAESESPGDESQESAFEQALQGILRLAV